ncbi:MAG TPA: serine--tRNA ligase, partial [Nocardioidaceae bacterium]|nr:serine--tRNA ligase [Nocardioidaceae bacterium]
MIDLRILREHPDRVRAAQTKRGASPDLVDTLLAADDQRRSSIAEFERLRAEQKSLGKQIAQAKGDDKQQLLARTKELSAAVKGAESAQHEAEAQFRELWAALPNIAADEAPAGGEDDFAVLEHVGTPRDFASEGFEPKDHLELGELLGAIDVKRGAKV